MAAKSETQQRWRGGTVCLSAHSDDVWLAIHKLKRLFPLPETLVTVFSVSHYASFVRWPQADIASVREREDRRYARLERAAYVGLGFEDEPARIEIDADTRARVVSDVCERLGRLLVELAPSFLLAPFAPRGPGLHVCHQVVLEAAIEASGGRSRPTLALYDDLVYARLPVSASTFVNGSAYEPYRIPLSDDELREKLAVGRIYESQAPGRYERFVKEPAPGDVCASEVIRLPRGVRVPALEPYACGSSATAPRGLEERMTSGSATRLYAKAAS